MENHRCTHISSTIVRYRPGDRALMACQRRRPWSERGRRSRWPLDMRALLRWLLTI